MSSLKDVTRDEDHSPKRRIHGLPDPSPKGDSRTDTFGDSDFSRSTCNSAVAAPLNMEEFTDKFKEGDHVKVLSKGCWTPGRVDRLRPGGSVHVTLKTAGQRSSKTIAVSSSKIRFADDPESDGGAASTSSSGELTEVRKSVRKPPRNLYVSTPLGLPGLKECSGIYQLCDFNVINAGRPLWRLDSQDHIRWMYFGLDSAWHIGDETEKRNGFQCSAGLVHSTSVSNEEFPDEVPSGSWKAATARGELHEDPAIRVSSLRQVRAKIDEALTSAKDKDVLEIINNAVDMGIPVEVLDTVFPMCIYICDETRSATPVACDLVTKGEPHLGLHWKLRTSNNDCNVLHRRVLDSGDRNCGNRGYTPWVLGTTGEKRHFTMRSQFNLLLPDRAEVAESTHAMQWCVRSDENEKQKWRQDACIVISQAHARIRMRKAMIEKEDDFASLKIAMMLGKIAKLPEKDLDEGQQAMDKAFRREKEITVSKMASRGVSLRQMLQFYHGQVANHYGDMNATTHDVVIQRVQEYTKENFVSLAEQLNSKDPKCPTHHIVHSWHMKHADVLKGLVYFITNYKIRDLEIDKIEQTLLTSGIDVKILDERYFFCGYCVNQHISCNEVTARYLKLDNPRCETNVFEEVAQRIHESGGNMIVTLDEDFQLLKRIWCLDEIHEAIKRGMRLDFTTSKLVDLQEEHFADVCECGATIPADKERILKKIEDDSGFEQFNETVKNEIKKKFQYMKEQANKDQLLDEGPQSRINKMHQEFNAFKDEQKTLKKQLESLEDSVQKRIAALCKTQEEEVAVMKKVQAAMRADQLGLMP